MTYNAHKWWDTLESYFAKLLARQLARGNLLEHHFEAFRSAK
jgi:hypothetical protein